MNTRMLNAYLLTRIEEILGILKRKGSVYTPDFDRFKNFKETANILHCTKEQALIYFMTKHLVWLYEFVGNYMNTEINRETKKEIDEKIGDIINYLLLLNAMFEEKYIKVVRQTVAKENEETAKQEGWE